MIGYKVIVATNVNPVRDLDEAVDEVVAAHRRDLKFSVCARISLTRDRPLTPAEFAYVLGASMKKLEEES